MPLRNRLPFGWCLIPKPFGRRNGKGGGRNRSGSRSEQVHRVNLRRKPEKGRPRQDLPMGTWTFWPEA